MSPERPTANASRLGGSDNWRDPGAVPPKRLYMPEHLQCVALPDVPAAELTASFATPAKAGAYGWNRSRPSPGRRQTLTVLHKGGECGRMKHRAGPLTTIEERTDRCG
jgi:hypothetical protein